MRLQGRAQVALRHAREKHPPPDRLAGAPAYVAEARAPRWKPVEAAPLVAGRISNEVARAEAPASRRSAPRPPAAAGAGARGPARASRGAARRIVPPRGPTRAPEWWRPPCRRVAASAGNGARDNCARRRSGHVPIRPAVRPPSPAAHGARRRPAWIIQINPVASPSLMRRALEVARPASASNFPCSTLSHAKLGDPPRGRVMQPGLSQRTPSIISSRATWVCPCKTIAVPGGTRPGGMWVRKEFPPFPLKFQRLARTGASKIRRSCRAPPASAAPICANSTWDAAGHWSIAEVPGLSSAPRKRPGRVGG